MPMSTDEEEDELLVYDRGERPSSAKKDDVQVSGVLATRFPERRPQKLDCTKDRHEVKVDKPRAKKEERERRAARGRARRGSVTPLNSP